MGLLSIGLFTSLRSTCNLIQMEDEKEHCEKELEGTRSLLLETLDEKKRLEVETDQLKSLLKREVAQFDSELVRT